MTEEEFQRVKHQVLNIAKKWYEILMLNNWHIEWSFQRERCLENPYASMSVNSQWEYMQAYVTVYAPVIADKDGEDVEHIILHEMAHMLVSGLSDAPKEAQEMLEERLCTELAWSWTAAWNWGAESNER